MGYSPEDMPGIKRQVMGFLSMALRNDETIRRGVPVSSSVLPLDVIRAGVMGGVTYMVDKGYVEKINDGEEGFRLTSLGLEKAFEIVDSIKI